jgi:hypothetical protein
MFKAAIVWLLGIVFMFLIWPLTSVTCMISQNTGGATHTAHTCFWDAETDGG